MWISTPCAQNNNTCVCQRSRQKKRDSQHQPLFEVKEDLPQTASSADHVEIDGSQEGEVDFDDILSEKSQNHFCFWIPVQKYR